MEAKLNRDGTRLEENYCNAKPAVDYAIYGMNFPVYLSWPDTVCLNSAHRKISRERPSSSQNWA